MQQYIEINPNGMPIHGSVSVSGAKNAVLVQMAASILVDDKTILHNVPASSDVFTMKELLESLGATVVYSRLEKMLMIDASTIHSWCIPAGLMKKMRASVLVMGPLLHRFSTVELGMAPGGCVIGARPIDYHLNNFSRMGVQITHMQERICAHVSPLKAAHLVLDYPSVGATENIILAAACTKGVTKITNAALEPEVLDLITLLRKMGAHIEVKAPAIIEINGVDQLHAAEHTVMPDRLEAGVLLLAAAMTNGSVTITNARPDDLTIFLDKLSHMGHIVTEDTAGLTLKAGSSMRAVSFKTGPYPSFPTDLQAPMMAAQTVAEGTSVIEETVFENRLVHVQEFMKMGAQINVVGTKATVTGVQELYGAQVIASDIRASIALVLAGLVAKGRTHITGVHHFIRAYDRLDLKLNQLGADITLHVPLANNPDARAVQSKGNLLA